MIKTLE